MVEILHSIGFEIYCNDDLYFGIIILMLNSS